MGNRTEELSQGAVLGNPSAVSAVSTAVTMNMMHMGMMASMRKTGLTGIMLGSANQEAEPTLDHWVT